MSAKLLQLGLTAVILTVGIFSPQIGIAGSEDDRDETRRLDPDRPHLPEASTAVGKGHVVLESGYTFAEKGSVRTDSYPEAVLRVGMFADWFELRIGQNLAHGDSPHRSARTARRGASVRDIRGDRRSPRPTSR